MTIGDALGGLVCVGALAVGCWLAWLVLDSSRADQLDERTAQPLFTVVCTCDGEAAVLRIESDAEMESKHE